MAVSFGIQNAMSFDYPSPLSDANRNNTSAFILFFYIPFIWSRLFCVFSDTFHSGNGAIFNSTQFQMI